jgi:hypothetical protein
MERSMRGTSIISYLRSLLAFIFASAAFAVPARGAEISVVPEPTSDIVFVRVLGALELADGDKFAAIASQYDKALVVLASDGGNLVAGLRIGQLIRLHGFSTLVPDGARCASACAIAWLGGVIRFMQPTARIGFHAAYRIEDGVATETGAGNALVGAYLSRLGLSDSAIFYVERAPPTQITWLTKQDAEKVGIEVAVLPPIDTHSIPERQRMPTPSPPLASPRASPPRQQSGPIAQSAAEFISDYFTHWSESNSAALSYFGKAYAPRTEFYGKLVTRELLLEQKRKFAERWPQRVYTVRPATINTNCDKTAAICIVIGTVDWDVRNANLGARSTGTAEITLKVRVDRGYVEIMGESGSVIDRRTSDQ